MHLLGALEGQERCVAALPNNASLPPPPPHQAQEQRLGNRLRVILVYGRDSTLPSCSRPPTEAGRGVVMDVMYVHERIDPGAASRCGGGGGVGGGAGGRMGR